MKEYLTHSPAQTKKLGRNLSKKTTKKSSSIVALFGDLGGGKTCFLQGFAKGLGIKEKILSPTFVIMKKYKMKKGSFYHVDCYRIQNPKEILGLGFRDIISNPKNIIAIEWADRIEKILPKNILKIRFRFIDKTTRRIVVE